LDGFLHHVSIQKKKLVYLCTDINPHACRASKRTGTQNKVRHSHFSLSLSLSLSLNFEVQKKLICLFFYFGDDKVALDCINASFALPLLDRLQHQVDVVLFNPPYVPTGHDEALSAQQTYNNTTTAITGSWAGGIDGMQITNHFLEIVQVRPKK